LPWTLPEDVDFKPTGESPLKSSQEFKERVERLYGEGWKPEYDTMDTFVDSSWYYLRYCDSRNQELFAEPKRLEQWLSVDLYLIGPEHIVLHLLYSRFFTKFLRDQGFLKISEPFAKMRHQGMILGPDGRKMSKSKGNVINPDKIVNQYGITIPGNVVCGFTATTEIEYYEAAKERNKLNPDLAWHTMISIEPIHEMIGLEVEEFCGIPFGWVIVGAETGNRKNKVLPKREWIEEMDYSCAWHMNTPIFMKGSLRELMGADFIQQYPAFICNSGE